MTYFLEIPPDPNLPQFAKVLVNLSAVNFAVQTETVDGAECYHVHFTGPYCAQLSPDQMEYMAAHIALSADDGYGADDGDYEDDDDSGADDDDYGAEEESDDLSGIDI